MLSRNEKIFFTFFAVVLLYLSSWAYVGIRAEIKCFGHGYVNSRTDFSYNSFCYGTFEDNKLIKLNDIKQYEG